MKLNSFEAALALALALDLVAPPRLAGDPLPNFASPAIGTLSSKGAFRLNNATLLSNATLFEGTIVETGAASSQVELASGTRMALEAASQAKVFGDHIVLERGSGRLEKSYAFRMEARGLTIRPDSSASVGRVQLLGARRVQVAATSGSFRVLNLRGMVVAKISSGKALVLERESSEIPSRVTGVMLSRSGHYVLTDETTNISVELVGSVQGAGRTRVAREALARETGRRVTVLGFADPAATPVSNATEVIQVAALLQAPTAGTAAAGAGGAAPAGAGAQPPPVASGSGGAAGAGGTSAAASTGLSPAMVAVIGGVAAAAVLGGLAATGTFRGGAATPLSR